MSAAWPSTSVISRRPALTAAPPRRSVGLETVTEIAANLLLLAVFFARTGRNTSVHFHFHVHQWVLVLVTAVLARWRRRPLRAHPRRAAALLSRQDLGVHPLRRGGHRSTMAQSPRHLALAGVGSLGGPIVQIVALWLCVHALGGQLPFVQVGAVYLGGHLVASAAPVPGGLGALEAALIAGLSALGMPVGAAASAVLIYRLLTYWLTIPVGWLCLKVAEQRRCIQLDSTGQRRSGQSYLARAAQRVLRPPEKEGQPTQAVFDCRACSRRLRRPLHPGDTTLSIWRKVCSRPSASGIGSQMLSARYKNIPRMATGRGAPLAHSDTGRTSSSTPAPAKGPVRRVNTMPVLNPIMKRAQFMWYPKKAIPAQPARHSASQKAVIPSRIPAQRTG